MAYASWSVVFGEQPSASKWNILGTNDSSFNDGTGIADSKILPRHLLTGTGSTNWVWQSWTPTWTSDGSAPAIGNGTLTGKYLQVGKTVFFRVFFKGGSGTTWGTGTYFLSLPVTAASDYTAETGFSINGYGEDTGVLGMIVTGTRMHSSLSKFYVMMIKNTTTPFSFWGQTAPITWGTGDYWSGTGVYEAA